MQNKYCDLLERYQGYRVTKDGRVWSDKRKKWLKTVIDRNGYVRVHLMINGKNKSMLVHRLVAETYIPNQSNLSQCCKGGYFDKRRNTFVKITQHKGYKWSYE